MTQLKPGYVNYPVDIQKEDVDEGENMAKAKMLYLFICGAQFFETVLLSKK